MIIKYVNVHKGYLFCEVILRFKKDGFLVCKRFETTFKCGWENSKIEGVAENKMMAANGSFHSVSR